MGNHHRHSYQLLVVLLPFFICSHSARAETSTEVTVARATSNEQQERNVDQVAAASQELAISRLNSLLKKYKGTSQEPVFLAKLADFQQQEAAILFRIAHGKAHQTKKPLDLSRHHKLLNQSIASLDRLLSRYPNYEEISRGYFLRGKAYEELNKKQQAGKDYLHLVKNFPNAEESTSAYMSLAEFAIEANDHPRAITYLKEVEKRPEDPHYPFALYKLAWSHHNLKKTPEALAYAERQIAFYNDRNARAEVSFNTDSDRALKENTLLDLTIFYFQGYEDKLDPYSVENALAYFKKQEKGPTLGKMLLRFAKLLRSHSHETDIMIWKNQVIATESGFPESLDILILTYEYQLNNQRYPQLIACARDMVTLYAQHKGYESFPKAQKLLLDTAEGLQKLIIKNKNSTEVGPFSKTLAQVYDSFVHMVEETDPRIPRVHYNLAETLFTIKDYAGATEHYRWVVDHGKWDAKPVASKIKGEIFTVADSSLKAIASRYEVLHQKGFIPKELKAQAIPSGSPGDLDPLLGQWVEWIDTHVSHTLEGTENFVFEANRALYAKGQIALALVRMAKFAEKYPKSQFAIPAASLVLDTYIASSNWEKTHETAIDFMDVVEWKKGDFSKKLFAVASDAFYKQLEERFRVRDYKDTLKGCDEFLKRYSTSVRLGDTLALAGSAALEDIDRKRAAVYFSRLITEVPVSPHLSTALLARASIHEDLYQFSGAARDYRAYLTSKASDKNADQKQIQVLRRKILTLSWLSGDPAELKTVLADKSICIESLSSECERLSILGLLSGPTDETITQNAFEKARKDSSGENKPLWAILALEGAKHLSFRDRNSMIRHAVADWDNLDPLVKFTLVPHLSQSIARAFKLNRAAMKEVAPLKANEKWITRRVEVIREMEGAATKVMKLPWARIRAETLNEIAGIYLDLSRGLAALPAPKDLNAEDLQAYDDTIRKLTMPFEEKGQDMRVKSFEIASRFAIEEDSFKSISEPFFAENPSQAKKLKPATPLKALEPLDLSVLSKIESTGGWKDIARAPAGAPVSEDLGFENPALYIRSLWGRAIRARHLPQVAFFMQEAQEKALIESAIMSAVKAISLAASGARGEGLAELEEARGDFPPAVSSYVTSLLTHFYEHSLSHEKVEGLKK